MSVCGQSGQTEEDSASEEAAVPAATRDIYKQKPASKVVRVLTVLAYLLSVSLAAILLSVYYICVWRSPELPLEAVGEANARRANRTQHHQHVVHSAHTGGGHSYGGGDTAVKGDIVQSTPKNINVTEDSVTEPSDTPTANVTALADITPGLHNGTLEFSALDDTDSIT